MRRLNYGIAHNATLAGLAGIGVLGISAIGAAGTVSPMAPNVAYAAGNVVSLTVGTGADATTTNYGTLSAAIAAIGDYDSSEESPYADDQYTITLLNDVTQDEGLTVSKKRFTLDLAGNTLTLSSGMTIKEDGHVVTKTSTSGGQIVGCVSLIGCELYAPIYHEVQGELITDNNGNPILDDQGHRQYASSLVIDQNTTDQAFVVGEGVTHNPKSGEKDAIVLLPAEGEDVGYLSAADIYGTVTGQVKIDKAITGTDTSENVPIAKRPMVVVHASGTVQATGTNQDVAIGLNGTGAVIVENGASVEGKETGIEAKSGILIVAGGTVKGNGATYNPTTPSTDNDLAVRGTGISVLCRGGNVPGTEVYVNANTISQPDCCVIEGKQSLAITNPHGVTPLVDEGANHETIKSINVSLSGGKYNTLPVTPNNDVIGISGGLYYNQQVPNDMVVSGFIPTTEPVDGYYTVYTNFASIERNGTSTSYATTQEAISHAQDGDTVKIIAPWSSMTVPGLVVPSGKNITLDLNGKSMYVEELVGSGYADYGMHVEEGASLTMENGKFISSTSKHLIYNEGTFVAGHNLQLNGTDLNYEDGAIIYARKGTVTITNGGGSMNTSLIDTSEGSPKTGILVEEGNVTIEADAKRQFEADGTTIEMTTSIADISGTIKFVHEEGEELGSLTANGGGLSGKFSIDPAYDGQGKIVLNAGQYGNKPPTNVGGPVKYPTCKGPVPDPEGAGAYVIGYTAESPDIKISPLEDQESFPYTGDYITTPAENITVREGVSGDPLFVANQPLNGDFSLTYDSNLNAGTGSVIITGNPGTLFEGTSCIRTFEISKIDITDVVLSKTSAPFDPEPFSPLGYVTEVKAGNQVVPAVDYNFSISPTPVRDVNDYYITATGTGTNVTGSADVKFTITPKSLTDGDIIIENFNGGDEVFDEGAVTIHHSGDILSSSTDYTISSETLDDSTCRITITGKDNYKDSVSQVYSLVAATTDIGVAELSLSESSFVYDSTAKTPDVTVTLGDRQLVPYDSGTGTGDYTVSYQGNVNAGTASVTVTGCGKYSGTLTGSFAITPASMAKPVASTDLVYNGEFKQGVPSDPNNRYSLSGKVGSTEAGTYTTTVNLTDSNYQWDDGTRDPQQYTWSIARCPVSFETAEIDPQIYAAAALEPVPTVTVRRTDTNEAVTANYTTTYGNNRNVGTATINYAATGNYEGTGTASFTIQKALVTVKVDNKSKVANADDPTLTGIISGLMSGDEITVQYGREPGEAVGTYEIGATVISGNSNYDVEVQPGVFTIVAAEGSVTINPIGNVTYNGQAHRPAIQLSGAPSDFTHTEPVYSNNVNAGTATVSIQGTGKYSNVSAMQTFQISKKAATLHVDSKTKLAGTDDPEFTATPEGLVNGDTLEYFLFRDTGEAPGRYVISATVTENPNYTVAVDTGRLIIYEEKQPEPIEDITFIDVNGNTPHKSDIDWLATNGISTGWSVGGGKHEFRPAQSIVRADMAAFLYRLAVKDGIVSEDWQANWTERHRFKDVNESTPHYKEIWWLASTGISTGWESGGTYEFRPYEPIVRQDMAAFLFRLATIENKAKADWEPSDAQRGAFVDVGAITPHKNEIWWMAANGISTGWSGNGGRVFAGNNVVLRQDMAAFLRRLDLLGYVF